MDTLPLLVLLLYATCSLFRILTIRQTSLRLSAENFGVMLRSSSRFSVVKASRKTLFRRLRSTLVDGNQDRQTIHLLSIVMLMHTFI